MVHVRGVCCDKLDSTYNVSGHHQDSDASAGSGAADMDVNNTEITPADSDLWN